MPMSSKKSSLVGVLNTGKELNSTQNVVTIHVWPCSNLGTDSLVSLTHNEVQEDLCYC